MLNYGQVSAILLFSGVQRLRPTGDFPLVGINAALFPSVLWHYWLDDRKGIWPIKTPGSFQEKLERKLKGNQLTQVHLENGS